jgi:DNA-binding response OmpR family regulator
MQYNNYAGREGLDMTDEILIVEDENSVAEILRLYLVRAGYLVTIVQDGQKALDHLQECLPDLVLLDVMLPQKSGWEITRWLRERSEVPVIFLTARKEEVDRIAGLEMGADDYVIKPFSPQEVVSRVRAVLRRTQTAEGHGKPSEMIFGDLSIDTKTRQVNVAGNDRSLTAKEFDLLVLLSSHPRQVYSRRQLLEQIWLEDEYIDPGTVSVHIRRLREKIEADPANPLHVITVWGIGYRFEP